jgi:hypothetical protein
MILDNMKSKSFAMCLTVLFFTVVFLLPNQNVHSEQGSQDEFPQLSYFANSPNEFFNETQHPRYALVNRPFGMIEYPNKANPSIIVYNEKLNIITTSLQSTTNWNFTLHKDGLSQNLDIVSSKYVNEKWYFETIPTQMVEGLYDLQLNCSEGDDYQTHAVKIVEEKTYPFTFVHISDLHFPAYDDEDLNSSDVNFAEFVNIRALDPDFVIVTGDLIQGPTLYFLDPVTGKAMKGEIQLRLGLWALDTLNLPVYYVHGNHEFSQSLMIPDNVEENWYNYLGPIRYQNFTYLDWTMVGFGHSFEGLNSEEFQAVDQILAENSDEATILYYHYIDFPRGNGQPYSFLRRFPLEVTLYGHIHSEALFMEEGILHHRQEPLFHGAFTAFSVLNETSLSVNSQIYNFELIPYEPPTSETVLIPTLAIFGLISYTLLRRRKNI